MNKFRKQAGRPAQICFAVLTCLVLLPGAFAQAADRESVYEQARALLQAERAMEAYELLARYEVDWSGEDAFDYLLGVAALDSGESGEAIFSLQRLVARRPAFSGARMELARAYFDIGDNELARIEFQQILEDNPPENVESAASEYLQAIDAKARAYQSDVQYFFDLGLGYDSNAPAATDDNVFLGFVLSPNNLEQNSAFAHATFGAMWNKPVTPQSQLLVNVVLDHRSNPSTHFVDGSNANLGVGWSWKQGDHTIGVTANTVTSWLARKENKQDTGINLSYARKLGKDWNLLGFVRGGQIRFDQAALAIQDVDQVSYGVSVSQNLAGGMFNFTLSGGADDAQEFGSPFSTDTYSLAFSNSWYRPGGHIYFLEANSSTVEFDDAFFGIAREDEIYGFAIGASWPKFPAKGWTTTLRISYTEKQSTVALYEFDRLEAGFNLRRMF